MPAYMPNTNDNLIIRPPSLDDVTPLLAFELENRAHFEQWIHARGQHFYAEAAVRASITTAIQHREHDQAYSWLVWQDNCIAGRVNLTGVMRAYFNRAILGYRIGHAFQGRGLATRAVALVLKQAFDELGLWRIEANVRLDNVASLRVLERNGFRRFGQSRDSFHLAGRWFDLVHFECRSPHGPSLTNLALPQHLAPTGVPPEDPSL